MNSIADYKAHLTQMGFNDTEADQITRARALHAKRERPGTIRVEKVNGEGEILLYDSIGFDFWTGGGTTPKVFAEQLLALGDIDRLTLRVNSPGGDVFDGFTILNILRRQQATIAVEVEGLAASAASFIIQAASPGELRVNEASTTMIHRAWGGVMGNAQDMVDMASVLEKLDGQIADIYAKRSKRKAEKWLAAMGAETWYTGQEAVDARLADSVVTAKKVAAMGDPAMLAGYRNVPELVACRCGKPEPKDNSEAEAIKVRLRILELEMSDDELVIMYGNPAAPKPQGVIRAPQT